MTIARFLSAAAMLGLAAANAQPVKLPPPFHTPSASNPPRVIQRPDGARLQVPAGFDVQEFAAGFERPRYMIYGPGGEILLSDSMRPGKVYALVDRNRDNRISDEEKKVVLEGLDRPFGLAIWKDFLYVAETTSVKRYRYDPKKLEASQPEEIVPLKEAATGHWTRTILFDRKGEKFYLAVGSQSNVSPGEPEIRAAILRFNPDGTGREFVATGTRNPIGLDWYPGTDTLWAAVQERDGLGDDLVPDYFTSIRFGGFYGWPYAYIGPNEDPRNKGQRPDLVAKTIVPDVILPAHVAVLDARFYTGTMFPERYRGGAFLAFHGSWNRAQRIGYSVAFIPFRDGKPAGPLEDFLTGFMLDPSKKEVWGRPVGLLQMKDGSLLVSDDGGNRIWRITYSKP
ncbi:MAG: PQQ-dependent sugar dehydrogenase [Bryobacteraceae bacterium]|nr:PQQ-dependent sugar dehydrogenase [Bryobacteraceae bacterium]MCX7602498.1 PQQ-dependent sugar dehydrogenase [Bryobacteraceae bacterium]